MSKILLAIIALIIVIVVLLGVYFVFSSSSTAPSVDNQTVDNTQTQNTNTTDIQGMKIQITKEGTGVAAKTGDIVTVNYVGTLADGKKFDSSIDRKAPFSFTLGQGKVIKGWDLGVAGMKVGEQRTLTIPPELAYGANGFPPIIPPNATLTFQVEMLKIGK